MRNERIQPREKKGLVHTVKSFARVSDLVLTVVFAYLAYTYLEQGGFWFWFFAASSVFCLATAFRSPIDMIFNTANKRLYGQRNG